MVLFISTAFLVFLFPTFLFSFLPVRVFPRETILGQSLNAKIEIYDDIVVNIQVEETFYSFFRLILP